MKRRILCASLLILSFLAINKGYSQCERIVWSDEFDSTEIDQTKWGFETGNGDWGWGTGQVDYATSRPENVRIENGMLIQELRKEEYQGFHYTSARMLTRYKATFKYGRIEARIKSIYSQGLGFAMWLLGDNLNEVGWPKCGEIDIFELTGKTPKFNIGTAHYEESWGHQSSQGSYTLQTGSFSEEFHVIGFEWSPTTMKWYIDGKVYHTMDISNKINGFDPFNHPFFLILSSGVGGQYSGAPDATSVFPNKTYIDYVRVYQGSYNLEIIGNEKLTNNKQNVLYHVTPYDAGKIYYWTAPAGATIVKGQGTDSVWIDFTENGGKLSVDITDTCGTASLSKTITVLDPGEINLAEGKKVTASSVEKNTTPANAVTDGDITTRWASMFSDPQWIYVDLADTFNINKVILKWETAAAKEYEIQVSNNKSDWKTVYTQQNNPGGNQEITLATPGRYVRIYGKSRKTQYGYSLFEIEVYGSECTSGCNIETSVSSALSDPQINIFPNPFDDKLIIRSAQTIEKLYLYDISGRELYSDCYQAGTYNTAINTENIDNGTYILKLISGYKQYTVKLIK